MSATTDRPLYFRSFEAALRPPATPTAGWGAVAERALQLLETPWPWDTSCTSMGVCPPGAACSQTTGFAIICAQGIVRDSVEPQLKAALDWWPTMLGGASDSEAHLVIVVLLAIALFNIAFVAHALASRRLIFLPARCNLRILVPLEDFLTLEIVPRWNPIRKAP